MINSFVEWFYSLVAGEELRQIILHLAHLFSSFSPLSSQKNLTSSMSPSSSWFLLTCGGFCLTFCRHLSLKELPSWTFIALWLDFTLPHAWNTLLLTSPPTKGHPSGPCPIHTSSPSSRSVMWGWPFPPVKNYSFLPKELTTQTIWKQDSVSFILKSPLCNF